MRLFIDSDTVFDVGDRVRADYHSQTTEGGPIIGTVTAFAVKIQADSGTLSYVVPAEDVELIESVSDLIRGWTRENEIRQYAEVHNVSIAGALALLVNSGLSHL